MGVTRHDTMRHASGGSVNVDYSVLGPPDEAAWRVTPLTTEDVTGSSRHIWDLRK
jgi:hypothetical protein